MTLDEAVNIFESGRRVVDGHPTTMAQTGDEYVSVCSGGVKEYNEVGIARFLYESKKEAIQAWLIAVQQYAADKSGTVYWRIRPELSPASEDDDSSWAVYSRFVISDKPEISLEGRLKIALSNRIAWNRKALKDCNVLVCWRTGGHFFAAREEDGIFYKINGEVMAFKPTEFYHKTLDEILEYYEKDQSLAELRAK